MTSNWFHRHHPRPAPKLRLFCFPHAGGAPSTFFHWPKHLPDAIEVLAAHLPGREQRAGEPLPINLNRVIDHFSAAVKARADLPFALFGHSFGALLAFEVARRLRDDGLAPLHLFSAARRAPHLPYPASARIGHLSSSQFLRRLQEHYGALPALITKSPEILAHFEPIIRADIRLMEGYRYHESHPFDFPITAYGGRSDARVSAADLEDWRRHTTGELALRLFPDGHFFPQSQLKPLLADIAQRLEAALTEGPRIADGTDRTL